MDSSTASQVKAARARSNSWFSQVKQREARLQAAEDKALEKEEAKKERQEAKREAKDAKKGTFFGSTLRRLSSGSKRDRRDSTSTVNSTNSYSTTLSGSTAVQTPRMTLNKNAKRKRTNIQALKDTSLRRVCFQLDELVELRTYVQVEAEPEDFLNENGSVPTVRDMTAVNPYASSTPLDRADLYLQCCKVYRTTPHQTIVEQFRGRGPSNAPWEGPRYLEMRDIHLSPLCAMALGDCLGLPLTSKHLTEVVFDRCGLNDSTLQLLLSCLYGSGTLERIEIKNNPDVTKAGVRCAICFLCLSPQIRSFSWAGEQFDSQAARILAEALSDSRIRALRELAVEGARLSDDDFASLLPAAQRAGVYAYSLRGTQMSAVTLRRIAAMLSGQGGMHGLDISRMNLDDGFEHLIDGLNSSSQLISLHLEDCGITTDKLTRLLKKLATLPNFRRLVLDGHDLRPLVPTLMSELPKFQILRRIGLARSCLEKRDIVALCEILAQANLSELRLSGVTLDASSLSALYALARVSKSLINLDIDIPQDAQGEKLGRRILAECIRNMETQEASTDFTDTDIYASVVQQHQQLVNNKKEMERHEELSSGAEGVISALDLHLDTTEEETAGDVPLEMLERARHIRSSIAPALAEPLSELQERRLQLVAATLDKVIRRFESTYPEFRPKVIESEKGDVYEHTGRAPAEFISANRHHPEAGIKSKRLEAEEGEIMKLANRMTDRLNILKSASASATPSAGPSRGELQDKQEAEMLEQMSAADGNILKARLYELQQNGHDFDRRLGHPVA